MSIWVHRLQQIYHSGLGWHSVGGCTCMGAGGIWEFSVLTAQVWCEPETVLKDKVLLFFKRHVNQHKKCELFMDKFTKYVQELYTESYKTLLRNMKEDLNKWSDIPCALIGRLNTAKMSIFSKLVYGFNGVPTQIPSLSCRNW